MLLKTCSVCKIFILPNQFGNIFNQNKRVVVVAISVASFNEYMRMVRGEAEAVNQM